MELLHQNLIRIQKKILIPSIFLLLVASLQPDSLLQNVTERVCVTKKAGKIPIVIFDLDGTLFDNGSRSKRIFLEFAEGKGDITLKKRVQMLNAHKMKYKVRESLIEACIEDSTLLKEILDSWRRNFFKNEYLEYDEPIPGSVDFVSTLHDSGALIIYLTGRDVSAMLEGTVSSLQENGFPIGVEHTELIMKPERFAKTFTYKKRVLKYIEKIGDVVAAFENEPANINLLYETFPDAISVFLETKHKPNAPPVNQGIFHLKNFIEN